MLQRLIFLIENLVIHGEAMHTVTITICPGPLVHSMDRMSWRNDNGEEDSSSHLFSANPAHATPNVISGNLFIFLATWYFQ